VPPWIPALASDTLRPPSQDIEEAGPVHHEPLLNVKAVETGVIDVSDHHHTIPS
jgi:mitotic spindle assembly checkpoint protein MAD2B